ncbi:DUF465 domain-containing protein [Desulfovibrio inopinatus]|uniref:DUF465 domain-containing protein n=1 Tax=Desulfovibrio inopinatus TaxID=102109 RepID=UPI000401160E|nr:DUF465 domain-containing protein [Desulfovibrio inopinatus]
MEQRDLDLIAKIVDENAELKGLYEEHIQFEKILEKYESKPFLTPEEDLEVKELKKKKLAGKTEMMSLLEQYRKAEAN